MAQVFKGIAFFFVLGSILGLGVALLTFVVFGFGVSIAWLLALCGVSVPWFVCSFAFFGVCTIVSGLRDAARGGKR